MLPTALDEIASVHGLILRRRRLGFDFVADWVGVPPAGTLPL
ncbi:MAG TPA: hypothetical protein VM555_08615 [Tahibacter sp.]|nr:hypothetical protein [Tahibacter sp.]